MTGRWDTATLPDDVIEALQEAEAYFDKRADAEYFTDRPQPVGNEEMRLLCLVRKALKGGE